MDRQQFCKNRWWRMNASSCFFLPYQWPKSFNPTRIPENASWENPHFSNKINSLHVV